MENQYYHFHHWLYFPGDACRNWFSGEAGYKRGNVQTLDLQDPQRVWSQGKEEHLIRGGGLTPQGFSLALSQYGREKRQRSQENTDGKRRERA